MMSRAEEGRLPILGTMSKGHLKTAVETAMCPNVSQPGTQQGNGLGQGRRA